MQKLCIFIFIASLFACSGPIITKPETNNTIQNINPSSLPEWVINPESNNGIAAVGIASPAVAGLEFQILQAEIDGKANIILIISSKISRITKAILEQEKVAKTDEIEKSFLQANKEVIKNINIARAKRINIYQLTNGTLFVRMMLENKDYQDCIKNGEKLHQQQLKQSKLTKNDLNKALVVSKALFKELIKETMLNNYKSEN